MRRKQEQEEQEKQEQEEQEQQEQEEVITSEMTKEILTVLFDTLGDIKYAAIRTSALDTLGELVTATEGTELLLPHLQELNKQLSVAAAADTTLEDRVKKLKSQLLEHPSKKRKS